MSRQNSITNLLGPADPARGVPVPPAPPMSELIQRAEALPEGHGVPRPDRSRTAVAPARPPRRLSLAMAGVAAVGVAAAVAASLLTTAEPDPPAPETPLALGGVVVPIAYEVETDPPPAADYLRALTADLTEAPYEQASGEYAYLSHRSWGSTVMSSPEGHDMAYVEDWEFWVAADNDMVQRHTILGAEFPNEESRRYWQDSLDEDGAPEVGAESSVMRLRQDRPLPTDRAGLTDLLQVSQGPGAMVKPVATTYSYHLVPRPVRAEILEVLAEAPGFVWRGEVTDRSGREGVAISYDDLVHDMRLVLVFDPATGVLLADELIFLESTHVSSYTVFDYGRADERPAVAQNPVVPTPGG